jgi:hypothetical protein
MRYDIWMVYLTLADSDRLGLLKPLRRNVDRAEAIQWFATLSVPYDCDNVFTPVTLFALPAGTKLAEVYKLHPNQDEISPSPKATKRKPPKRKTVA